MLNQSPELNDVGLCPSHHLPLDRRHAWTPTGYAFMCAACESLLLARCASRPSPIPDLPPAHLLSPDEAMRVLVEVFNAMRP